MTCGRPVLAYGSGGVLETVLDGRTGLFFYEQTPAALRQTILDFEDKAASFDPGDDFNSLPFIYVAQIVDYRAQTCRVLKQRGDVVKIDAGLGKIRHFSDQRFKIHSLADVETTQF